MKGFSQGPNKVIAGTVILQATVIELKFCNYPENSITQ